MFSEKYRDNKHKLLASSPVDTQFEIQAISIAIGLMSNMLTSKYPTTLADDRQKLEEIKASESYRLKLALIHRIN